MYILTNKIALKPENYLIDPPNVYWKNNYSWPAHVNYKRTEKLVSNIMDSKTYYLRPSALSNEFCHRRYAKFWPEKSAEFFQINYVIKVRIFWEGHKIWNNLPLKIWRYWVVSTFKWKMFSNFVAFSEYPNFNIIDLYWYTCLEIWNLRILVLF